MNRTELREALLEIRQDCRASYRSDGCTCWLYQDGHCVLRTEPFAWALPKKKAPAAAATTDKGK